MKAILCTKNTDIDGLIYGETPAPEMGPDQVRIAVYVAGVNFPDTLIIQGIYQTKPAFPFSPGGEVAGRVLEVGAKVKSIKVGDRVTAFSTYGGYAEEIAVNQQTVFRIPEVMSYSQAAGLLAAYGTSYHALVDRALAMPGETLLVLGASGSVGTAAIQVGKALGLKVIAVASTPEKLDFCRAQGADEVINYSVENVKEAARQLTAGAGVDIVLDLVGGSMTDQVLSAMKWKGRLLILGFTSGTIPSIAMNRLLLKGCAAIGVYYGAFMKQEPEKNAKNVEKLMKLFEDRKIFPMISREYPLERAVDALRHIAARGSLGKITLLTERGRTGA